MKRSDYKNHLDKIKCSPEFRIRMEERLSAERDGEYADSVSDVERVTKINYHRWTALAASAVLVLGIGGAAFSFAKNGNPTSENILSDVGDDEKIPFVLRKRSAETYSMNVTMFNYDFVGRTESLNIGNIPEEAADKIISGLERCDWDNVDPDKYNDVSSETRINIDCTGAEEFVYTIDPEGYAMLEREGEQAFYYNENSYFNIVSTIAYYLPYCDWNSMVGGETGEKLDVIFKEHIDEIKPMRSDVDGLNSWVTLMSEDPYTVYIDQYGKITVFYDTPYDSGNGGKGSNTFYFSSSPEMYEQIVKELGGKLEIETATEPETALSTEILSPTESVYKLVDENISNDLMNITYRDSSGQFDSHSFTVSNVDMNTVIKNIKSLTWEISENSYPKKDFYIVRNLMISLSGEIYDTHTGTMYVPADDDFSDLTIALSDLLSHDDFTYVMSLLANSGKNNAISCSDFTLYYSDAVVPLNTEEVNYIYKGGTGIFYHDNSCNEYYMIIDSDSYTAEYFESKRYWTMIESGNIIAEDEEIAINSDGSLKKITSGFSGMDYCFMDYDTICNYAITLINDIYTSSESTSSVDCKYDENTGCFTFSLKGSLYESNVISMTINITDGNVVKAYIERLDLNTNENVVFYDFQLGDGMGGGINYYTENLDIYSQISDEMKIEKSQTED